LCQSIQRCRRTIRSTTACRVTGLTIAEREELGRLRKQNRELRTERDRDEEDGALWALKEQPGKSIYVFGGVATISSASRLAVLEE